ncbi:hypothetical protein BVRB_3g069370 [Beta vulgaris subsp. vulgaris]|uniref:uncharacterized protein LOC104906820 n=1 Tax=Beta vulgaris subsp. vulgaris TaxID=3555 RepID=UPI00053F3A26|nr:uncharacterized protein LOC104906820 [Beta vulgaris subsp. vulgaris]KMS98688.1 hypothetical protein BVRB_3g069370 [Beta vulgaris subsp. vulgaris]
METHQSWKLRFSFKNATIFMCLLNLVTALFLLQGFFSPSSSSRRYPPNHPNSVELMYVKESEEIRRAMQPFELIRRVREIEQELYAEPETVQHKEMKQTAAVDLSKRLTNIRSFSDAASVKALEEWRKRKMERARQREMGRNATAAS